MPTNSKGQQIGYRAKGGVVISSASKNHPVGSKVQTLAEEQTSDRALHPDRVAQTPLATPTSVSPIGYNPQTGKPNSPAEFLQNTDPKSLENFQKANPNLTFNQEDLQHYNNATPSLQPLPQGTLEIPKASPYQQGFNQIQSSGIAPPQSQGAAQGFVDKSIPISPQANPLEQQIQEDPGMQMLMKQYTDYMHSVNQRDSLTQEYDKLSKKLGIQKLDTQLMNAKNIIEGTEDDIRNEVTKAGGFATDSQVLALANSRNKVLIKNYNNLLETRNNAQQTLTTMIGLAQQDRQAADQAFNMQMNFTSQILSYRDKMITNAQNSMNNTIKAIGYGGLLQNALATGDPYAIGRIERTLGMPTGSLTIAAQKEQEAQAFEAEKNKLSLDVMRSNLATDAAQRSNIYSQIASRKLADQQSQQSSISPYQAERQYRTIQSVDELGAQARQHPGIFGRTAALPLPSFLRTDAFRNFSSQLNTLKANIAFGELTAMREASKTGGALGQISDREGQLLQDALGGLNMTQSPTAFNSQLSKIKGSIERWQQAAYGTNMPVITAPNGDRVIITD